MHKGGKSAEEELEREIRLQRRLSLAEAIAAQDKRTSQGACALPALQQARSKLGQYVRANLRDLSGALERQFEVQDGQHESLLGRQPDEPLEALWVEPSGNLATDAALLEFLREVDQRYGQMFGERLHLECPGQAPLPEDDDKNESVRAALSQLLTRIAAR